MHAHRRPSSAVRHRCRLGGLPAMCVHDAIVLRLAPLLPHLEPTRASSLGRAACAPEHKLLRPPPRSLRRAPLPAWAPSQPTFPGPPLGHMEATRAAHCWAPPLFLPESELSRPRRHCSAAATCRWHLRPIHRHQSREGNVNLTLVPFVCLHRAHIAGGDLPSAVGALRERDFGTRGPDY
jgi:hypothetical protein